jgi:hypothetical protein
MEIDRLEMVDLLRRVERVAHYLNRSGAELVELAARLKKLTQEDADVIGRC